MVAEAALPSDDALPQRNQSETLETEAETTFNEDEVTRWEVVAFANGLAQASIIQGRLETEGIPTQVRQEPAGIAIGLTVGTLGQAEILVPEPMAEKALSILNQSDQEFEIDEDA